MKIGLLLLFLLSSAEQASSFRNYNPSRFINTVVGATENNPPPRTSPVVRKENKIKNGFPVVWEASAKSSIRVREISRSCEEYMALPASEYSVLTADQITRLSDTEFKCVLGTLNFFGNKFTPVLYVTVNVIPELAKSEIIVDRAETVGGEMAELVNGTFSISAINTVFAGEDKSGRKTLNSDTKLKIDAIVPPSIIPRSVIKNTGSFLIQSSLNVVVPTFVRILAADFRRWSAGNNERTAVEGASLEIESK